LLVDKDSAQAFLACKVKACRFPFRRQFTTLIFGDTALKRSLLLSQVQQMLMLIGTCQSVKCSNLTDWRLMPFTWELGMKAVLQYWVVIASQGRPAGRARKRTTW
jgi:hypothetical protein